MKKSTANWVSNGLGGQSMFLLMLAARKEIPATVTITADTGSELDRVCSNGERMTAPQFFYRYVLPYAEKHGIEALFVRAQDKDGIPFPPLFDIVEEVAKRSKANPDQEFNEMVSGLLIPIFTNDKSKGRLRQTCTDKFKIRAVNQEARRRGITTLRNAIGFHAGECHRIKARFLKMDSGFSVYKPQVNRDGVLKDIQWLEHYYPCIDLGVDREKIRSILQREGLPYLVTTECDKCPHQDYARWIMHTPEELEDAARVEACFHGKLFFTDKRIPLKQALELMRLEAIKKGKQQELPGFGCENGAYCGI